MAAAAKAMMVQQDGDPSTAIDAVQMQGIEAMISGGAVVSEADFTFVGSVIDHGWDFNRMSQMPIESALQAVGPGGVAPGTLFDAILSDTASR